MQQAKRELTLQALSAMTLPRNMSLFSVTLPFEFVHKRVETHLLLGDLCPTGLNIKVLRRLKESWAEGVNEGRPVSSPQKSLKYMSRPDSLSGASWVTGQWCRLDSLPGASWVTLGSGAPYSTGCGRSITCQAIQSLKQNIGQKKKQ